MHSSFTSIDAAIIVAYLAALVWVGFYFSRRQTDLDAYFIADRRMSWLPVGLSLMAALNSGIDYLMQPSATIRFGLVLLAGTTSWVFVYPWVSRVTLPFYRQLRVYTAYEYLEARFDVRVRTLAATIFILWRLGWMATALYVPCLAIDAATGSRLDLRLVILTLGILVTMYTMLGGIQAVIWNDVIQFCVMFGGLGATMWIVEAHVPGGWAELWSAAGRAGEMSAAAAPLPATDLLDRVRLFFTQPITLPAIVITMILGRMASYTSDQVMVQRCQTTRSVADARRAYVINAVGDVIWMFGLSMIGVALLAYFTHHVLPPEYAGDKILPYFMAQAFPSGAAGLVIAAILAASLSSIDSAINSCTSVFVFDIFGRFRADRRSTAAPGDTGVAQVRVARGATLAFGLIGTLLAMNVSKIGTLLEIANKLINAFSGPLFGIYVAAMFSRRASSSAVLAGGVFGTFVSYYVAYHTRIGFLWPSAFGLFATLAAALAMSAVQAATGVSPAASRLTWYDVMRQVPGEAAAAAPVESQRGVTR